MIDRVEQYLARKRSERHTKKMLDLMWKILNLTKDDQALVITGVDYEVLENEYGLRKFLKWYESCEKEDVK